MALFVGLSHWTILYNYLYMSKKYEIKAPSNKIAYKAQPISF